MTNYWKDFYKTHTKNPPSNFAMYINKHYCQIPQNILEIGCGDGRDAYYLSKNNNVIACDLAIKNDDTSNCKFIQCDMGNINLDKQFDIIYSRFSLHSVNQEIQNNVIDYAKNHTTLLVIECRSTNDNLYGQGKQIGKHEFLGKTSYAQEHYRRFIDKCELENQLKEDFEILESEESIEFAPYKNEKPCCLRIVAKKMNNI